jgi:hypothetical protein
MRKTSIALTLPRRYPRSRCSMERTAAMEAKDKFYAKYLPASRQSLLFDVFSRTHLPLASFLSSVWTLNYQSSLSNSWTIEQEI